MSFHLILPVYISAWCFKNVTRRFFSQKQMYKLTSLLFLLFADAQDEKAKNHPCQSDGIQNKTVREISPSIKQFMIFRDTTLNICASTTLNPQGTYCTKFNSELCGQTPSIWLLEVIGWALDLCIFVSLCKGQVHFECRFILKAGSF